MHEVASLPGGFGCLATLPRVCLQASPTPLERMRNLERQLGSGPLYVKRDDCCTLAFGGNKVRQLEYYLGEAQAANADTVLITGAVQSNFVRLAAAGAAKLGMDCHIQLEERVPSDDPFYRQSGNVLLDQLLGATLYRYADGEDEAGADKRLRDVAQTLESEQGRRCYVIPLAPGHKPLGALGYLQAAQELQAQLDEQGIEAGEIVVASGSGNTHAGLLYGLRALGNQVSVVGVCVRRDVDLQRSRIEQRCAEIAELLETHNPVASGDVVLDGDFLAPGYGKLNPQSREALLMAARHEGLIVDPTYTAKSLAAFIHRARSPSPSTCRVFIHTGGTPGVFGYQTELASALGNS